MSYEAKPSPSSPLGKAAAWGVFILAILYALTTLLGFLALKSPLDPIGDPYFTLMELLILLMAPLMVVTMVALHQSTAPQQKTYSLAALAFMLLMAGLTMGIHFVILTVSRSLEAAGPSWAVFFFAFKWPSVAYTLDILAWDIFFPLSFLCALPIFRSGRLEGAIRILMMISVVLCFAGLIGIPLANMSYRNIGIIGYAVFAPVVFLLLGIRFNLKAGKL